MHIHSVIPAILLAAGAAVNAYTDYDELEFLVARAAAQAAAKSTAAKLNVGPDTLRRREASWANSPTVVAFKQPGTQVGPGLGLLGRSNSAHGQDLHSRSHGQDVHARSNAHGQDLHSRSHGQDVHARSNSAYPQNIHSRSNTQGHDLHSRSHGQDVHARSNTHGHDLHSRSHGQDVHARSNAHGPDVHARSNGHGQDLHSRSHGQDVHVRSNAHGQDLHSRSNVHGQDVHARSNVHGQDVHARSNSAYPQSLHSRSNAHGQDVHARSNNAYPQNIHSRSNAHGHDLHSRSYKVHEQNLYARDGPGSKTTSKGADHDKKITTDVQTALKDCGVKPGEGIVHSRAGVDAAKVFAQAKGYKMLELCLSDAELKDRADKKNGNKYADTLQVYMTSADDFVKKGAPKDDWLAFWTIASSEWAKNAKDTALLLTIKDAPVADSFFKTVEEPILLANKVKVTRLEGTQGDGQSYIKAYDAAGIKKA